jgi:drug/metabolite transporter (DMT)-like permease
MIKNTHLRTTQAAVGCGAILIFFVGILGIVLSFFTDDRALAATIRTRCVIGICLGIGMVVGWKLYKILANKDKD